MLTRFVKIQLAIFTTVGLIGITAMALVYVQVPTLFGIGRYEVTLRLPSSGGLYRFSNVTYRGVQVGKVTEVRATPTGAEATISLAASERIPAHLRAEVRSVSAVGEQYVDLQPLTDSGPYLESGSVIAGDAVSIPTPVGPMLDRVSRLVESFPEDRLGELLEESNRGFNGSVYDFGSLIDSGASLSADLNSIAEQARTLADDARPLLEGQAATADAIRTWGRGLAGFTGQLRANDPQLRALLDRFPGFSAETTQLLDQLKPTLPLLLGNLGTVSEILMTYNPSIEQLLVLLPPYIAQQQSYAPLSDSTGSARGDFAATVSDPPACTVGFLPPSSWRSPADETEIDTPEGLYCKLPQDSPIAVRGARNFPCIRHPGKRAPTVELCNGDQQYAPLAMREHVFGPYPFDPSLIAQGIPPDDRTTLNENIYAPLEGTPLPAGPVSPLEAPLAQAPPAAEAPPAPAATPPPGSGPLLPDQAVPDQPVPPPAVVPPTDPAAIPAAPSAFSGADPDGAPDIAVAQYNPRTGEYVGPDGKVYEVTNLVADSPLTRTWKDLLPH